MADTIEAVLRKMIGKQADVDESLVTPDASLDDLGVTSLDLVEIIMSIEDQYDISIDLDANAAARDLKTVGDLIALARSLGLSSA